MAAGGVDSDRGSDFNERVIAEFRANRGHVGGQLANTAILLLHHVGARSALARVTPLAYARITDGRIVIVASNGGAPAPPRLVPQRQLMPVFTVTPEISRQRIARARDHFHRREQGPEPVTRRGEPYG